MNNFCIDEWEKSSFLLPCQWGGEWNRESTGITGLAVTSIIIFLFSIVVFTG